MLVWAERDKNGRAWLYIGASRTVFFGAWSLGYDRCRIFCRRRFDVAVEEEGFMINIGRVLSFSALGFLLLMMLVIGTGCAGRSYNQLAAQTQLSFNDRGVVVVNLSQPPQLIEVLVYAPGMGTVRGPERVYIQPFGSHAFVIDYAGNQSVTIVAQPVDNNGCPIGKLVSTDVSFPWGHYVGNAADYRRNHISLTYENGGLRRRN